MKKIILISLFLSWQFSFSQNLVPNPSFEDTVSCPVNYTQMNKAVGWDSYRNSPDYFNSCNNGFVGVPSNDVGFQIPKTGNSYAGFLTYTGGNPLYREAMGCQLLQPMIIGQKYFINFWTSMAFKANASGAHINTASNKIGIRFSTIPYSVFNSVPINNFAHIVTDSIINDTTNWVNISGSFVADSAYDYLSIGNFFDNSHTSVISLDTLSGRFPNAYYYVDDIYVSVDSLTGIDKNENNFSFEVFPNPTSWIIHYKNPEGNDLSISVYSSISQLVLKYSSRKREDSINLGDFANGIYMIIIKEKEQIIFKKIIKY